MVQQTRCKHEVVGVGGKVACSLRLIGWRGCQPHTAECPLHWASEQVGPSLPVEGIVPRVDVNVWSSVLGCTLGSVAVVTTLCS